MITWNPLFHSQRATHRRRKQSLRRLARRRILLEGLESRRLLATITVTSLADNLVVDELVTLREAIQAANTNKSVDGSTAGEAGPTIDTIEFQSGLTGTITLGGTRLEINDDLTINGPGAATLTISGNDKSQIFFTSGADTDVTIRGLTLTKGFANLAPGGGAIGNSEAHLAVVESTISGNSGSGVHNAGGAVAVTDSTITGNSSSGLYNYTGSKLSVTRCTITDNSNSEGGGIFSIGDLALTDSTIAGNDGGGLLLAFGGKSTVTSSTISGNTGAGIRVADGLVSDVLLTVTSSTIVDNRAGVSVSPTKTSVLLFNSIVAGNETGGNAMDINGSVGVFSAFNLIGDPATAGGMTEGRNLLGDGSGSPLPLHLIVNPTLTNNGGSTDTHLLVTGSLRDQHRQQRFRDHSGS